MPGDFGERPVAGVLRQAAASGTVIRLVGLQPGLAVSEYEEHLPDERTLRPEKCHRHEDADLQGRCHNSVAAIQTGRAVHPGRYVAEDKGLCSEGDTVPLLGDPGGGQLSGSAERGGPGSGHSRYPVGIGRWYRKYFRTTSAQMSSKGCRN